jgi:hypothetical protein
MSAILDFRDIHEPWSWLCVSLGVGNSTVIAVIGGAGKTTFCREAARGTLAPWFSDGRTPWLSTTTKIARASYPPPFRWFDWSERSPLTAVPHGIPGIARRGRPRSGEQQAKGMSVSDAGIAALALRFRSPGFIEADGSRGRPGKFYRDHEPPIPARADMIVQVTGWRLFTEPISDATIHALRVAPRHAPWTLTRQPTADEAMQILRDARRAHESRIGKPEWRPWHLAITGASHMPRDLLRLVTRAATLAGGFSTVILLPEVNPGPTAPVSSA